MLVRNALAGVVTLSLLSIACGGGDQAELTLDEWAVEVCAISEEVREALDTGPPVDLAQLSVAARKARARAFFPPPIEKGAEAAEAMEAIEPPAELVAYHGTLTAYYRLLSEAGSEALAMVEQAETVDDINAANDLLDLGFAAAARPVFEAPLTRGALAALGNVPACGLIASLRP